MFIHVEIVSRERKVFEEREADMVLIPASEGQMGVLPRHAPVVTTLTFGELIVKKGSARESFAIYGGVVDIRPGKVVVLAELARNTYDIDAEAAEAARAHAQKFIQESQHESERRSAVLELRRATLELQLSRKLKNRVPTLRIIEDPGYKED